jgi:hypothetical protein
VRQVIFGVIIGAFSAIRFTGSATSIFVSTNSVRSFQRYVVGVSKLEVSRMKAIMKVLRPTHLLIFLVHVNQILCNQELSE